MADYAMDSQPSPPPPADRQTMITLRLPRALHLRLRLAARDRYTSMNKLLLRKVEDWMDAHERCFQCFGEGVRECPACRGRGCDDDGHTCTACDGAQAVECECEEGGRG